MLTHNDKTVDNAYEAFEKCKNAKAGFFGMKEEPLSLEEMKKLFGYIKSFGKQTFLEVVAYSEKEGLDGAKMAAECKCDYLMGTKYFDSINVFCKENQIKYMPFIGEVLERPSILEGNIEKEINEVAIRWGMDIMRRLQKLEWIPIAMDTGMCKVYIP